MARLRNKVNGVVVNVDDDTAARLGTGTWEPADESSDAGKPKRQTAAQKREAAAEKAAAEKAAAEKAAAEKAAAEKAAAEKAAAEKAAAEAAAAGA